MITKRILGALALPLLFSCGISIKNLDDLVTDGQYKQVSQIILEEGDYELTAENWFMVCRKFSDRTDFERSIPLFEKYLEIYPDDITARLLLANNYRENKQYNEALSIYNDIINADSIKFMVLPERARLYISLDEMDKAKVDIAEGKNLQPKYFANFLADGLMHYAQGQQDVALDLFQVAVDLDPGVSAEASLYAGYILLTNRINYDAMNNFTRAIEVRNNINVGFAFINRGVCQINLQDTTYACNDWDSAFVYLPDDAQRYIGEYCP